jgi:hypothetical protein
VPVAQLPQGPPVYRIWLTSFTSADLADRSWLDLMARYPDLLGNLALTVRRVDLGVDKGVWYRVLAGPFEDQEAARAACDEIRRRSPDENCMAVVN